MPAFRVAEGRSRGSQTLSLDGIHTLFKQSFACSRLTEKEQQVILERSVVRRFSKGDIVVATGDAALSYYFMLAGKVRVLKQAPGGRLVIISIMKPGDTFVNATLFSGEPASVTCEAIYETLVLSIPRQEFAHFVFENPSILVKIFDIVSRLLVTMGDRLIDMVACKAEERVVKTLDSLCREYGSLIPLSHQDIASIAGTSRETASRVLDRLQQSGTVVCERERVRVLNATALGTWANSRPPR